MGKRFYNLNLSPINRHRGPGHLSSPARGAQGWWQRRWKLSGAIPAAAWAPLGAPAAEASPPACFTWPAFLCKE